MNAPSRSQFAAAVGGGLVVAGALLALGVTGHRSTETIVQQSPVLDASSRGASLTPHAIYARSAPGVVYVRARTDTPPQDAFAVGGPSAAGTLSGAGFLISASGLILTDDHLVRGADALTGVDVQFEDGTARPAAVVATAPDNDLAVLKVSMRDLPAIRPLELGDSSTVRVGDPTLSIGNPSGADRTLSSAIVAGLPRQLVGADGFVIPSVIRIDAPADPADAGGPLLDAAGRVIGVNSVMAASDEDAAPRDGIAFAVPIDTARELMSSVAHRRPPR
jgi:putative serine protease PepD